MKSRPFIFVEPGGNWGDHLIYLGAQVLAQKIGLLHASVTLKNLATTNLDAETVIYLQGSGGFNVQSRGRALELLRLALAYPTTTIVQGPCTVADQLYARRVAGELEKYPSKRVFFFAREQTTYELCAQTMPKNVELLLNEDTAFYLNQSDLEDYIGDTKRSFTLYAVRADNERIPAGNGRISGVVLDPAKFANSLGHWIRIHAAAEKLITNRTHSAICGSILGIPTEIFAGSYHKNRSVWEHSLHERGVVWRSDNEGIPGAPSAHPWLGWVPVARVRNSYRLNALCQRLQGIPAS